MHEELSNEIDTNMEKDGSEDAIQMEELGENHATKNKEILQTKSNKCS